MSDMGSGRLIMCLVGIWLAMGSVASAQPAVEWESVTEERLLAPEDGDWMSYRRTYDVTGFSPLDQINRSKRQRSAAGLGLLDARCHRLDPDADRRQRADVRLRRQRPGHRVRRRVG